MTTGTDPDRGSVARRQAAEYLGVDLKASPAEARRAYYRKVREYDFLPPPSLQSALRVLDPKPGRAETDADWLLEEERRLRADIDAFAGDFFRIPVVERGERWDELLSRCPAVSPLRGRLEGLEAGLTVEPGALPSDLPCRGELTDHLLESFPLPPLAQAASRQALLRRIEGSSAVEQGDWEGAARYLNFEWPAVAALDRELLGHIANLSGRRQVRRKMLLRSIEPPQTAPTPGGEGSHWWIVPVVVVAIGLLRGAMSTNNSTSTKTPSAVYEVPRLPSSNETDELLRLSTAATDELRRLSTTRKLEEIPFLDPTSKHPPIQELLDSSEYDVEVLGAGGSRVLCFTPRLGSKKVGRLFYGEATLRIQGLSRDEVNALFSQAEKRKRTDRTGPQKSTGGDRTLP